MENLLKKIEELREKLLSLWELLGIERAKVRLGELKEKMNEPDFWSNRERAVEISREAEYEELKEELGKQEFFVLFSGKHDSSSAILSIHAGTGGVDAQDWAQILERMFLRFAEDKGWKVEVLDRTLGAEAGIKSATFRIDGKWAYGYLRSESGVHRLVRISPFDAEQMRHTSFALVEVIPELPEAENVEIKDADLRIDVYRASGPGGQGVNTTDPAGRILHQPPGLVLT